MVTARIDLKGLNNELTGFKTAFDKWAQTVVSDADLQKDRHHNQLRELQSKYFRIKISFVSLAGLPCNDLSDRVAWPFVFLCRRDSKSLPSSTRA